MADTIHGKLARGARLLTALLDMLTHHYYWVQVDKDTA